MAIIADEMDSRGYVFENQYIRVDRIEEIKKDSAMRIEVGVYMSQQQAQDGGLPHRAHAFHADFDLYSTDNLWQQAYVAVKRRYPEHTDA